MIYNQGTFQLLQRYVPRFPLSSLLRRKLTDRNQDDLQPAVHFNRCNERRVARSLDFAAQENKSEIRGTLNGKVR